MPVMRPPLAVSIAALGLLLVVPLRSGGPPDDARLELPAHEILERAADRAQAQATAAPELGLESQILTTVVALDDDGQVTEVDTTRHRRYPVEGVLYDELVARDGRPLSEAERREERERRRDFVRRAREARRTGEKLETNDDREIQFDEDLIGRFRTSYAGTGRIDDRPVWVVAFEPRSGDLPERTRLDRALNRSEGRFYIAQEDAGVMRVDFRLREPISYLWGLVGRVNHAEGQLTFDRVAPGVWLPSRFDVTVDIRILFRTGRKRFIRQWLARTPRDGSEGSLAVRLGER